MEDGEAEDEAVLEVEVVDRDMMGKGGLLLPDTNYSCLKIILLRTREFF